MEDEIGQDKVVIITNVSGKELLVDALISLGMLLLGMLLNRIF